MKKIILVLLSLMWPSFGSTKIIERVIAVINDQIITLSDLSSFKDSLKNQGFVDDLLVQLTDPKKLESEKSVQVDYLIHQSLLDQAVTSKGLSISFEKVNKEISKITQRNGMSLSSLKTQLKNQGVAFAKYQSFIKSSLERHSLIEKEVSSKIKISEDEISSYYVKNDAHGVEQIFSYKIAHILFLTGKNKSLAASNAKETIAKLKTGKKTFEQLAAQYSQDPNFSQGGLLGAFKAGEMMKPMENAVKTLEPGQTSAIVTTRAGLHVIKLLKKSLVPNPIYEKQKPRIRNILFAASFKKQLAAWLSLKKSQSFIKINK